MRVVLGVRFFVFFLPEFDFGPELCEFRAKWLFLFSSFCPCVSFCSLSMAVMYIDHQSPTSAQAPLETVFQPCLSHVALSSFIFRASCTSSLARIAFPRSDLPLTPFLFLFPVQAMGEEAICAVKVASN